MQLRKYVKTHCYQMTNIYRWYDFTRMKFKGGYERKSFQKSVSFGLQSVLIAKPPFCGNPSGLGGCITYLMRWHIRCLILSEGSNPSLVSTHRSIRKCASLRKLIPNITSSTWMTCNSQFINVSMIFIKIFMIESIKETNQSIASKGSASQFWLSEVRHQWLDMI